MPSRPAGLLVQQVLPSPNHLVIVASLDQASAACPSCEAPSSHVHSRYERTLGDLPCQGQPVTLRVNPNTVHFGILTAAVKSIRTVGIGVRGRSG
jgi:transposase